MIKTNKEFFTYAHVLSYGTISIDASKLEPSADLLSNVQSALAAPVEDARNNLQKVFRNFGHVIPIKMIIGGKLTKTYRSDGLSKVRKQRTDVCDHL